MSSIKLTGLVDMKLLYKLNEGVLRIHDFWNRYSVNGKMTAQQMFSGLQEEIFRGISEDNLAEYLKNIHSYEGNIHDVNIG